MWRSLDGRHLYAHARTAGFLYQAELRHALTQSLGLEWEPVSKGVGEVAGVPHEVLREFTRAGSRSKRRWPHGATCRSRPRGGSRCRPATKDHDVDPASPGGRLAPPCRPARTRRRGRADVVARRSTAMSAPITVRMSASALGDDGRPRRRVDRADATFDRRAVIRIGRAGPGRARRSVSSRPAPICSSRAGSRGGRGRVDRRAVLDRRAPRDRTPAPRPSAVAVEPRGRGVRRIRTRPPESVEREQAAMVTTLTTDGAGVSVVVGAAGTGKTHALAVASEAWRQRRLHGGRLRAVGSRRATSCRPARDPVVHARSAARRTRPDPISAAEAGHGRGRR